MTDVPPTEFALTVSSRPPTLTVRVTGELDYGTSDELIHTVAGHLPGDAPFRDVRLDFTELTWIDSSGLSALLMVHRRTSAVEATLHLDNRPDFLERMLLITNVLDHLTAPVATAKTRESGEADDITEAGAT